MIRLQNIAAAVGDPESYSAFQLGPITLDIPFGEMVAIVGSNGAGKSSLLRLLAGYLPLRSGSSRVLMTLDTAMNVWRKTADVSMYLDQNSARDVVPSMTFLENIELATIAPGPGALRFVRRVAALDLLEKLVNDLPLDLARCFNQPAGQLSGGERQLLVFLRALIFSPTVLLLDEFTSALASPIAHHVVTMVKNRVEANRMFCILVTHDIELALAFCGRIIFLREGCVAADLRVQVDSTRRDLSRLFSEI